MDVTYMYTYCDEQIIAGIINFSNPVKVEMYSHSISAWFTRAIFIWQVLLQVSLFVWTTQQVFFGKFRLNKFYLPVWMSWRVFFDEFSMTSFPWQSPLSVWTQPANILLAGNFDKFSFFDWHSPQYKLTTETFGEMLPRLVSALALALIRRVCVSCSRCGFRCTDRQKSGSLIGLKSHHFMRWGPEICRNLLHTK